MLYSLCSMYQLNCLEPKIIPNPLAGELIAQYGNYTFNGQFNRVFPYLRKSLLYEFSQKQINPYKVEVTPDNIDNCYVTNFDTGECFPLYIQVPCGHCSCCQSAKVNAFVHRAKLETMCYDSLPIFLTLTYNEKEKPKNGVNVRDVQLFFKRLRINLQRKGYREKIRYLCVSEYCPTRSRRPHYHILLWNLHQTNFFSYRQILSTIDKSWNKGFIVSRFVESSDDKCFRYTAKYMCKINNVPDGQSKNFCLSSNRGGGIGSAFIDRFRPSIQRNFNRQVKFLNRFTNRTEDIYFNRYVLNRLFPTFCSSIPSKLKSSVRDFILSFKILKDIYHENVIQFQKKAEEILDFFGEYFYCPDLKCSEIKASLVNRPSYHWRSLVVNQAVIDKALRKGQEFFDKWRELAECRQRFLGRLFMFDQPLKSLENIAINFDKSMSLAIQRQTLV